jgi:hypothetical protein
VAKTVGSKSGKRGGVGQAMMGLFTRLSVRLQRHNYRMVERRRTAAD